MKIKNKQVSGIYDRWNGVWKNERNPLETRLKAFSIMRTIKSLVIIYEHKEELDEEDIDDLFISWGKDFKPVLPEEYPAMKEAIRKQLKRL